jgi:hypothetical protein
MATRHGSTLDATRIVKWLVVVLLAVWLLQIVIARLTTGPA